MHGRPYSSLSSLASKGNPLVAWKSERSEGQKKATCRFSRFYINSGAWRVISGTKACSAGSSPPCAIPVFWVWVMNLCHLCHTHEVNDAWGTACTSLPDGSHLGDSAWRGHQSIMDSAVAYGLKVACIRMAIDDVIQKVSVIVFLLWRTTPIFHVAKIPSKVFLVVLAALRCWMTTMTSAPNNSVHVFEVDVLFQDLLECGCATALHSCCKVLQVSQCRRLEWMQVLKSCHVVGSKWRPT